MKSLISKEIPEFALLQETKLDEESINSIENKLWNTSNLETIGSRGVSGGLFTLWNLTNLHLVSTLKTTHWITTIFTIIEKQQIFTVINVYIHTHFGEKEECWNSVMELKATKFGYNCIIGGEFNTTMGNHEKIGGSIIRDA